MTWNIHGMQHQLPLDVTQGRENGGVARDSTYSRKPPHRVAALFAGIGGIEAGLASEGHSASMWCESDAAAIQVLRARMGVNELNEDIRSIQCLPTDVSLVAGGFPCQDLSQAGRTAGITGLQSSLVGEVFRLLGERPVPWVLLENVPFMLQLAKGRALEVVIGALEELGYSWAYRIVDSRAFGLPQRRERVYILASLEADPRTVLFADEEDAPPAIYYSECPCGFYWTEGLRGLGWANNAVPTLKGGSAVGIPSAPAVVWPTGRIVTPTIEDAEALQGFPRGWTSTVEEVARSGTRWKLVGNAVSVPVAKWLGSRMRTPGDPIVRRDRPMAQGRSWPRVAWNVGGRRMTSELSPWPVSLTYENLADVISQDAPLLSLRATKGFLARAERSSLRFPEGFLDLVREHARMMETDVA